MPALSKIEIFYCQFCIVPFWWLTGSSYHTYMLAMNLGSIHHYIQFQIFLMLTIYFNELLSENVLYHPNLNVYIYYKLSYMTHGTSLQVSAVYQI